MPDSYQPLLRLQPSFAKGCRPVFFPGQARYDAAVTSTLWLKLLSVFGLGMIGLWEGIPAGFALRLPALVTGLLSGVGSLCATLIVLLLGERIRTRLLRRRPVTAAERPERLIDRVWRRYGILGLGLLGPGLTGAPLGVALGLSLRAPARRLMAWMTVGIVLWTIARTVVGMLGTAGIVRLFSH